MIEWNGMRHHRTGWEQWKDIKTILHKTWITQMYVGSLGVLSIVNDYLNAFSYDHDTQTTFLVASSFSKICDD